MSNLEIYCVTDKELPFLEESDYKLAAVGKGIFSEKYLKCDNGDNIFHKEKNYSELTFHYWFWKNQLQFNNDNDWIGFCQKRRFWLNSRNIEKNNNILEIILKSVPNEWENYDSVICEPLQLGTKLSKLVKRGWKNILKKPSLIFNHHYISIKIHFDLHHGYGVLDKAISVMNEEDKEEFKVFVNENKTFNPHIMFISKKKFLEKYFQDQFDWLFRCEKIFGFEKLKGYDKTRLYAFLAERYMPFWFRKYSRTIEWPWIFSEKYIKI
tara:strand:- start:482 stop:1282 length:801 start_codon:yes stop_codon:yes gene_type:complete